MIEAFVGLVGGGKTYSSTRRMCEYVIAGGVVCTNILFKGYDVDTSSFAPDCPFLKYLLSRQWQYQEGQYIYIPFDTMCETSDWFKCVPGGQDRNHRTLLCIDEATDLFDTLDRSKLNNNSAYRELFRFLRLSRHAHIDVLFICQDLFAINSRLRGLVSCIWKSTDLKNFRLPTFHIPLPFNVFMLQRFDRSGKLELSREFLAKDPRVFSIYDSEAFHDSLGISFSGPVANGKIKEDLKMTTFQKFLLFLALLVSFIAIFKLHSLSKAIVSLDKKLVLKSSENVANQSSLKLNSESSHLPSVIDSSPDTFIRGEYDYRYYGTRPVLYFDSNLIQVGMITEYGKCLEINPTHSLCVNGNSRTFLLPRLSVEGPPKTAAFAPSPDSRGDSAL